MAGLLEVPEGMGIFRRIAATNVTARQAHPKVYPGVAILQTFLATAGCGRLDRMYLILMRAVKAHFGPPRVLTSFQRSSSTW